MQEYIASGVLEQYCLGQLNEAEQAYLIQMAMLYPEVKAELTAVELAFEELSAISAVGPPRNLKQNILAALGFNNVELDVNDLPVLRHSTDAGPWLKACADLIPEQPVAIARHLL